MIECPQGKCSSGAGSPNESQLPLEKMPETEPDQLSELKKRLLGAFKGLRRIKHKISFVPAAQQCELLRSFDAINKDIDDLQEMICQLGDAGQTHDQAQATLDCCETAMTSEAVALESCTEVQIEDNESKDAQTSLESQSTLEILPKSNLSPLEQSISGNDGSSRQANRSDVQPDAEIAEADPFLSVNAIIARLNSESVDFSEIIKQPAPKAITDSELLEFGSFGISPNMKADNRPVIQMSDAEEYQSASDKISDEYLERPILDGSMSSDAGVVNEITHFAEEAETQKINDDQFSSSLDANTEQRQESHPSLESLQVEDAKSAQLQWNESMENQGQTEFKFSDATRLEIDSIRAQLNRVFGSKSEPAAATEPNVISTMIIEDLNMNATNGQIGESGHGPNEVPVVAPQSMGSTGATTAQPTSRSAVTNLVTAAFLNNLDDANEEMHAPVATEIPKRTPVPTASGKTEGGDESVSDYMGRLFQRLRGGEQKPEHAQVQSQPKQPESPVVNNPVPSEPVVATVPMDKLKDGEFMPMKRAPERNADMNALRQLANESTRSAIQTFTEQRKKSLNIIRVAAIGGGVALSALFFSLSQGFGDPMSFAGMASVLGSIVAISCQIYLSRNNHSLNEPSCESK